MRQPRFGLPVAVTIVLMALTYVPGAQAAARFSCRASAVRAVFTSPSSTLEPTVSSRTPCADVQATNGPQNSGPLHVGKGGAFTHGQRRGEAPGAGTLASLTDFELNMSGDRVVIQSAQAQAWFACSNGKLEGNTSSQVSGVSVNGAPVSVGDGTKPMRVAIDKRGSYLQLNPNSTTSTSEVGTAAFVHIADGGDFTDSEAVVSQGSSPCARTSGFLSAVQACAAGSIYDPAGQDCLITASTKRPIFISRPFRGPTGGIVYSLKGARRAIKGGHCLGPGSSRYAIVGTPSGGGLVTGTSGADRILTVSGTFTIHGLGGRDCFSAGRGTVSIRDQNAPLTVYSGSGSDQINVGNGNDRFLLGSGTSVVRAGNGKDYVQGGLGKDDIKVGNGRDRILLPAPGIHLVRAGDGNDYIRGGLGSNQFTVGNGNDTIIGGAGFTAITAGNGNDTIDLGPGIGRVSAGKGNDTIRTGVGFDQITARGSGARVTCVDRARVAVPPAAVGYARAHGCQRVTAL